MTMNNTMTSSANRFNFKWLGIVRMMILLCFSGLALATIKLAGFGDFALFNSVIDNVMGFCFFGITKLISLRFFSAFQFYIFSLAIMLLIFFVGLRVYILLMCLFAFIALSVSFGRYFEFFTMVITIAGGLALYSMAINLFIFFGTFSTVSAQTIFSFPVFRKFSQRLEEFAARAPFCYLFSHTGNYSLISTGGQVWP